MSSAINNIYPKPCTYNLVFRFIRILEWMNSWKYLQRNNIFVQIYLFTTIKKINSNSYIKFCNPNHLTIRWVLGLMIKQLNQRWIILLDYLLVFQKQKYKKNMNIFQTYCNEKIIFLVVFLVSWASYAA